jgi:hypothetical protein
VDPGSSALRLSAEMKSQIERLPVWSEQTKREYHQFFARFGTHVVTRLALGGALRVIIDSQDRAGKKHKNPNSPPVGRPGHIQRATILRDGGASVAAELTRALEDLFLRGENSLWQRLRDKWIKDLERDPVFCPDDPITQYALLYTFPDLNGDQRRDLQRGSESYLATWGHKTGGRSSKVNSLPQQKAPRGANVTSVKPSNGFLLKFFSKVHHVQGDTHYVSRRF